MPSESTKQVTVVVPADLGRDSSRAFLVDLDDALDTTTGEIVLDCSHLWNVTSSQIGILWQAKTRCDAAGMTLRLAAVGSGLEKVLKLLDLYDVLVGPPDAPSAVMASEPERATAGRPAAPEGAAANTLELEFEVSTEGIGEAMDQFRSFLASLGLPEMCVFDLGTAFYEVATNARQHGGLRGRGRLSFTAVYQTGKVRLTFVDSGCPFDPSRQAPHFDVQQAIRQHQNRGIGLFLVKKLMDSISYERVGDKNVVCLEKSVKK